jgi:hypothetical protein
LSRTQDQEVPRLPREEDHLPPIDLADLLQDRCLDGLTVAVVGVAGEVFGLEAAQQRLADCRRQAGEVE